MRRPYNGRPLWACLRHLTRHADSKIIAWQSGVGASFRYTTNREMAEELLYRFVRRWPKRILACDLETRWTFAGRYNANKLSGLPSDLWPGFLEAGNQWPRQIIATGWRYGMVGPSREMAAAVCRTQELLRKKTVAKKLEKMGYDEKLAFILKTQLEYLLHGKTRIRGSQDNSTKRYGRLGSSAFGGNVGIAQ